jgi:hypothetical protein
VGAPALRPATLSDCRAAVKLLSVISFLTPPFFGTRKLRESMSGQAISTRLQLMMYDEKSESWHFFSKAFTTNLCRE